MHPAFVLIFLLLTAAHAQAESRFWPVELSEDRKSRIGELVFLSGHQILHDHPSYGGISGMDIRGRSLLAITDKGQWLSGILDLDGDRITDITWNAPTPIKDLSGNPLAGKKRQDAEGLSRFGPRLYVSFEREHRIWTYTGRNSAAKPVPFTLPGLERLKANNGIESMTHLPDGRLLILAEGTGKETTSFWIHKAGPNARRYAYRPSRGFSPVGASAIPASNDVLVLERAFSWTRGFRVRIVHLSLAPGDINRHTVIEGREIARLEAPDTVDNFEAIAVSKGQDHPLLIDIMSDDNFNPLQRNLLLRFGWTPPKPTGNGS